VTLFDLIAIIILLVSGLVGFTRGAVRELVTVFAFTLAALAGVFLLPLSAPLVRSIVSPPWAATAAAVVVVFVIAYVALRLAGHWVTSHLHSQAALGAVDRTIGLGFGVLRALVFLGVFYLVFNLATPPELMPRWIADAKLLPVAQASAKAIQAVAPEGLKVAGGLRPMLEGAVRGDDAARNTSGDPISDRLEATRRGLDAAVQASQAQKSTGYDNRSRDSIDDLVEQSR
jgi:membrane protein required for colicin V production